MKTLALIMALLGSLAIFMSAPHKKAAPCYEFGGTTGYFPMPCAPQTPAFDKGKITSLNYVKDTGGTIIGIQFNVEISDTATTEIISCNYIISGAEFATVNALGAAAKRAAVLAIIKREAHVTYDAWKAARAARPKPPVVHDPLTDLGVTEIVDFSNEATPTPTP